MFETMQEAVKRWTGKGVRVTFGIWADGAIPEGYSKLAEQVRTRFKVRGVIKGLRPAIMDVGRCQWEFLVMVEDGSEWWLPRGAFDLTAHAKKRDETLAKNRLLAEVEVMHKPSQNVEAVVEISTPMAQELQTIESDAQLARAEGERVMKELEKAQEQQKEGK